jgi:hypothetical protein
MTLEKAVGYLDMAMIQAGWQKSVKPDEHRPILRASLAVVNLLEKIS